MKKITISYCGRKAKIFNEPFIEPVKPIVKAEKPVIKKAVKEPENKVVKKNIDAVDENSELFGGLVEDEKYSEYSEVFK